MSSVQACNNTFKYLNLPYSNHSIKILTFDMKRKKQRVFRMKQFNVVHERSANKVGVDGVLIGAWSAGPHVVSRILDAGCGCGLISLMLAQRFEKAQVIGIEIDPEAIEEAGINVAASPWKNRIEIINKDFSDLIDESVLSNCENSYRFDMIVSNPPFYHSGVDSSLSPRMLARHANTLSPEALIYNAPRLLNPGGILSLISPAEDTVNLLEKASIAGMTVQKICYVKGNPNSIPKRVMLQLIPNKTRMIKTANTDNVCRSGNLFRINDIDSYNDLPTMEYITIENSPGNYTEEYRSLCSPFYIIF